MWIVKILFLCLLLLSSSVYAKNMLYNNSSEFIDIGRTDVNGEIEVGKQYIYSDPTFNTIENTFVYGFRVQGEVQSCDIDALGAEVCPQEKQVCPSTEDIVDGSSVKHTTAKSFVKICPSNTIQSGDKCYFDGNGDGVKDVYFYMSSGGYKWKDYHLEGGTPVNTNKSIYAAFGLCEKKTNISKAGTVTIYPYGFITARHYSTQACDDDKNNVIVKINNVVKLSASCNSSKDTGYIKVYENTSKVSKTVSYYLYDEHIGYNGNWDNSNMLMYVYNLNKNIPSGFSIEISNGKLYAYKMSKCPPNTTLLSNGTCQMVYDWYEYVCPKDLSIYQTGYFPKDPGGDCGNVSCTNSPTPPQGNCVRVNYSCLLDPSKTCARSLTSQFVCNAGLEFKNNRCQRIEPYCGVNKYNALTDKCEKITQYTKLCADPSESFSYEKGECISTKAPCPAGSLYDKTLNMCTGDFNVTCPDGYQYNSVSKACENKKQKICSNGYVYDAATGVCVSEISICDAGETWNKDIGKCERSRCNSVDLRDDQDSQRCENTKIKCDGTLTSNGECIPNKVVE